LETPSEIAFGALYAGSITAKKAGSIKPNIDTAVASELGAFMWTIDKQMQLAVAKSKFSAL